ncbi:LD-carboxypeptidase [Streptomyces sp. NPDC059814]|uniref:S66 peptidase family protein n=1 Tax=unclassified Streptomyces TaxID=2593676 RepID=UPI003665AF08
MGTDSHPIQPYALRDGAVIGVWTPSSPAPALFPQRFRRALSALRQHGFEVRTGRYATGNDGLMAADPRLLAEDLHDLLRSPEVDAVVCAVGGYTSMSVLPFLDFDLIAESRKPIIGYSDVSALLWAILKRCSTITFHGPMVVSEWGESGGPFPYTVENFRRVLAPWTGPVVLAAPAEWTDEMLWWGREDTRPRRTRAGEWRRLAPGVAEGWLLPGCAPTVSRLFGTPYLPDPAGSILCLETLEMSPEDFYGLLVQWRTSGLLDEINGLVVGRHYRPRSGGSGTDAFDRSVLAALGGRRIPVLVDVDFGHTEPRLTLPVGVRCRIDATRRELTLLAPAVTERENE